MILPGFFILIFSVLLGCCVGVVTGLIPGLHTNTIATIVLGFLGSGFLAKINSLYLASFIIAMVITHSFVDYIPSIFLGAPESSTALAVLPGHKLLLKGHGYKALKLTVIGGMGAGILAIFLLPLFIFSIKKISNYAPYFIGPVLIIFSIIFILKEPSLKNKIWGFCIFILSGVLGIIVLNGISVKEPLFPLLSGLFGIPVLIISVNTIINIPPQKTKIKINALSRDNILNYFKATVAGSITSFMPAIGAAQAAIIAQGFSSFKKAEDFLVALGGINTIYAIFTLATLYAIGKTRSGAMVAINQIISLDFQSLIILIIASFIAIGLAAAITLKLGLFFSKNLPKINYSKISKLIIWLILSLVFLFSGFAGLFIVTVATAIGLLAPLLNVRRIHSMGVLVLPVIFYYIL